MALFYPAAVKLDAIDLSDQGRSPVSRVREERSVIVELANGNRKKYIKGVKNQFSFGWTWLPSEDVSTLDGYAGRDTLVSNFASSGNTHTLLFRDETGGSDSYTVFVTGYEEQLIRRSSSDSEFFWEITMSFEEQ